MPITLENRGRQMQVFNLPHELYCEKAGRCGCAQETVTTWVEDAATGERSPRSTIKRIPASLTLLAREKQLIFGRRVYRNTPSRFTTRVIQSGVQPNLHLTYKHSGVKQYFKVDPGFANGDDDQQSARFSGRQRPEQLALLAQTGHSDQYALARHRARQPGLSVVG